MMRKNVLLATAISALLLTACASTNVSSRTANQKVSDSSSVEAGLWHESDKIEKKLNLSAAVIDSPALNNYVSSIQTKVAGGYNNDIRIKLLEAPVFNAGIFPNGAMFIYSGLMLRAATEDELALVLAHENAHFIENHSLERHAAATNANIGNLVFSVATLGYGGLVSAVVAASAYSNFSKENEHEADNKGIIRIGELGYDQAQAINIWANLLSEREASSNKKSRKRASRSPVFGTHPSSPDRIERMQDLSSGTANASAQSKAAYRAKIRPHLEKWLEAELQQRDFGSLLHLIERLEQVPGDEGKLNYIRGRAFQLRNEGDDSENVIKAFEAASKHPDVPNTLWRDMGDVYQTSGDKEKAINAFKTYLRNDTSAADKALIEFMIKDLEGI